MLRNLKEMFYFQKCIRNFFRLWNSNLESSDLFLPIPEILLVDLLITLMDFSNMIVLG